uniref:SCAN box domain-containing protein n=1 Tax=Monodelphis domestica TaxID=13616 RepID=A0A5F8H9Y3_MONDO
LTLPPIGKEPKKPNAEHRKNRTQTAAEPGSSPLYPAPHDKLLPVPSRIGAEPGNHDELAPETWRKRFRSFQYQISAGPQETLNQLRELCHQWLQPEIHTKEQILELLLLEQFMNILPEETKTRVQDFVRVLG